MIVVGLSAPWLIAIGALLLFGCLVVLTYLLALVRETKSLLGRVRQARDRLQDAMAVVRVEAEEAAERATRLDRRGTKRSRP